MRMVNFGKKSPKKKRRGQLPRSMYPIIPEPMHRIPPKGVTEGISFRNLPGPSLFEIEKICKHYEAKCSGDYKSLASRYVVDMSKEIQSQITGIECGRGSMRPKTSSGKDSQIAQKKEFLSNTRPRTACGLEIGAGGRQRQDRLGETSGAGIFNWFNNGEKTIDTSNITHLDEPGESTVSSVDKERNYFHFEGVGPIGDETDICRPKEAGLPDLIQLKEDLIKKSEELKDMKEIIDRQMDEHKQQYFDRLELERYQFKKIRDQLIRKHKKEIEETREEITRVKKDAKSVIDFIRRKANEALAEEVEKSRFEKKQLNRNLNNQENKLKEAFNTRLHKIEEEVKITFQNTKFAVQDTHISQSKPRRSCQPTSIESDRNIMGEISINRGNTKIETDNSIIGGSTTGDSISTKDDTCSIDLVSKQKWFERRIDELDTWTDELSSTLQNGVNLQGSKPFYDSRVNMSIEPPLPPPIRRISTRGPW